jgi:glycerol-3-phosphate cytidylyltransferase
MNGSNKLPRKKVVYTAGTWDLFHVGHLNLLRSSKEKGDFLIVGVSSDELVESYKGKKPVIPLAERMAIIESCKFVDKVVIQNSLLEVSQLEKIDADILTIGDDWQGKSLEGIDWFDNHSEKEVLFLPYTKHISSTKIKEIIRLNSKN